LPDCRLPRGDHATFGRKAVVTSTKCSVCFSTDQQIRCEGASGFYYPEIKGYVTATKGEILAELVQVSPPTHRRAGNFARELRVDELGTRAIAKLIIELLARVYDLGTSDNLEYYAPLLSSKKGNPIIVDPERCLCRQVRSARVALVNDSGPAPIKYRLLPSGSHNALQQKGNPTGG
jgi:hypothetical protein